MLSWTNSYAISSPFQGYEEPGKEKIPALAFADDLLLLEDNDVHLPTPSPR